MLHKFVLKGKQKSELDTEVKFNIAVAKVDGAELVLFDFYKNDDEKYNKRILNCLVRVLGNLKRSGTIQFYVSKRDVERNTVESKFLLNKYFKLVDFTDDVVVRLYIKL